MVNPEVVTGPWGGRTSRTEEKTGRGCPAKSMDDAKELREPVAQTKTRSSGPGNNNINLFVPTGLGGRDKPEEDCTNRGGEAIDGPLWMHKFNILHS